MRNYAKTAITVALLALLPTGASAEEQGKEMFLSLKDGAVLVLGNNLDITIERVSPEIAEAGILAEEGAFDLSLFGSMKRQDVMTPLSARESVSLGGLSTLDSTTYSLETGVTGKSRYGTEYTLEVRNDWTSETLNAFDYEYQSFTGFTVTQPLLKGFGEDSNIAELKVARKDRDISVHRLKQKILDTVAEFGLKFWDLVRVREELKVRVESQNLAGTLYNINRKKLDAGAISALEAVQAEAAAAARKDDVIVALKSVKDTENAIKMLIASDLHAIKDTEIIPSPDSPLKAEDEGYEESVKKAVATRPDYRETIAVIDKGRLQAVFAEDQKRPEVDLEASYGYNGIGDRFSSSFDLDSPEWTIGLSFSYPIGNRAAVGALTAARLETDQAVLRLRRLEQQIILNIDNALKDIGSGRARLEAARIAANLTRESLVAEEKKLSAGRSTTFNVLRIQEDLAKARLNVIAAFSDLNKAIITYYREKGTLLDELSIKMD